MSKSNLIHGHSKYVRRPFSGRAEVLGDSCRDAFGLADVDDGTPTKEKVNTCVIGCSQAGGIAISKDSLVSTPKITSGQRVLIALDNAPKIGTF
jgi:hypothetical protein